MKRSELALHSAELGFTPQDAVRWLAPAQLGRTAVKVLLATIFADFGDKRELEGSFPAPELRLDRLPESGQPAQPAVRDLARPGGRRAAPGSPGGTELWLDFAADLGDGFDPSYTVALLLAQEVLDVEGRALPRGEVLVLGGDEVYPVAAPSAYEDRMAGPYRTALPAKPNGRSDAVMLALPGNHDWYDGLTSFIRMFTRQRNIGGWRTIQTRSYFALRLSGGEGKPGWWLLGLDSQLGQYIDEPQLDYFYANVTSKLLRGDAIILCVASPYWVETAESTTAFKQVHFFERDYLLRRYNREKALFEPTGASVRLWLSGDLHHYSRYAEAAPGDGGNQHDPRRRQLVTCGLGGAYLADAAELPPEVTLPFSDPSSPAGGPAGGPAWGPAGGPARPGTRFVQMPGTFPGPAESAGFRARLANPLSPYWLPARNPGFGMSAGFVHVVVLLTLWTVFSAFRGVSFVDGLVGLAQGDTVLLAAAVVAVPAALLGLQALLADWLTRRNGSRPRGFTVPRGLLYQLVALAVGIAVVLLIPWPAEWPHIVTVLLVLAVWYLLGFTAGSEAFALFIMSTPTGEVASWKMSGQAIEDHKGFLRMRLAPDGLLTIHPLAVDTVCRDWDLQKMPDGGVRPVPSDGLPPVRLFEQPVTISREGFPP